MKTEENDFAYVQIQKLGHMSRWQIASLVSVVLDAGLASGALAMWISTSVASNLQGQLRCYSRE